MMWKLLALLIAVMIPIFEGLDVDDAQYLIEDDKKQFFVAKVGPDELHKAKANQKKKSTKDEDVNDEDIEKFVKDMFTQKSGDYADEVKAETETFIIHEE